MSEETKNGINSKALVPKQDMSVAKWTKEKWDKVKEIFFSTIKDPNEFEIFMELAKTYDLSPFLKEIWAVPYKRKDPNTGEYKTVMQMFSGRDGFLSIAHKSGNFNGMHTEFGYTSKGALQWAETTVYNKSCQHPVKCKVFIREYTTGKNLWASKPHTMLQKVSESQALRRAFNISGLYCPEEMPEPQEPKQITETKQEPKQTTQAQEPDKKRGDLDKALKTIEDAQSVKELTNIQKALERRQWNDQEIEFLLDKLKMRSEAILADAF